jgi:hypothetical protein
VKCDFLINLLRRLPARPVGWGPPSGVFRAVEGLGAAPDERGWVVRRGQKAWPAAPGSVAERTGLRPETQQPHPIFWRKFEKVHVVGQGHSPLDGGGRIAFEGFMSEAGLREEADYNFWSLPRPRRLKGRFTSLSNARFPGDNYYHWIHDCLSKALLLENLPSDTRILVENPSLPFKRETLQMMGLWDRVMASESRHYFCEEFYFLAPLCLSGGYNPEGLGFLRSKLLPDDIVVPSKQIFVTRRSKHRHLSNLSEVEKFFLEMGWEVVDAASLSFSRQVEAFRHAERICGLHGAALTNLAWCSPGTKVLEIFPGHYLNACYEIMAHSLGLAYRPVILSDRHADPWHLDCRWLVRSAGDFLL